MGLAAAAKPTSSPVPPTGLSARDEFWQLLGLLRGQVPWAVAGFVVSLIPMLTALPVAESVRFIFDHALDPGQVGKLIFKTGGISLLMVVSGGFSALGQFLVTRVIKDALLDFRRTVLAKIYQLPRTYHDARERARLHDLVVHDAQRVGSLLGMLLSKLGPGVIIVVFLLTVLATRAPELLLAILLGAGVVHMISRRSLAVVAAAERESREAFSVFNRGMITSLRQMELAWLHGSTQREHEGHGNRMCDADVASIRTQRAKMVHGRVLQAGKFLVGLTVLVIGGSEVAEGRWTLGQLISHYMLAGMAIGRLRSLGSSLSQLAVGRESLAELRAFLAEPVRPPYHGSGRLPFRGQVVLDGVAFGYVTPGRERRVLERVDLRLEPGRITAIRGANGSGKTTLINLILGLYRPDTGRLLADGRPYDELDMEAFRQQIGIVPQDPFILQSTIRENIVYAKPDASPEAIVEAARLAGADRFVSALPAGYETRTGELGGLLSGGQRQRLALARALLPRPRLLILDEPTNHLDRESVQVLLQTLVALPERPAILIISHHPVVADVADECWRLSQGKLWPDERKAKTG